MIAAAARPRATCSSSTCPSSLGCSEAARGRPMRLRRLLLCLLLRPTDARSLGAASTQNSGALEMPNAAVAPPKARFVNGRGAVGMNAAGRNLEAPLHTEPTANAPNAPNAPDNSNDNERLAKKEKDELPASSEVQRASTSAERSADAFVEPICLDQDSSRFVLFPIKHEVRAKASATRTPQTLLPHLQLCLQPNPTRHPTPNPPPNPPPNLLETRTISRSNRLFPA